MAHKLFGDLPDMDRLVADTGFDRATVESAVGELAWITKTISRPGKGYVLGQGHGFSRPDSDADVQLRVAEGVEGEQDASATTVDPYLSWVTVDELAGTLADRAGLAFDVADGVVAALGVQVDEQGHGTLKVATRLLELERVVEDQLMEDPWVLAPWGWEFDGDPKRQVGLGDAGRADIVGQLRDGSWAVIELKSRAALVETAEQVLRYVDAVRSLFADDAPVRGLVVADGDDVEFHERVLASPEDVVYLPTRALNLPACRPQSR